MLNIIVCFERTIERQTVALLRSIKRYCTYSSGIEITAISPRVGFEPTSQAVDQANALGAHLVIHPINKDYRDYPLANKPLSCEFVANHFPSDEYLFLDSDTMFINNTELGMNNKTDDVQVRVVDGQNVGTPDFDSPNGLYWQSLYKIADAKIGRLIHPSNDIKMILEYYNSGFIFTNRSDLFDQWAFVFKQAMNTGIRPDEGLFFVEQTALAATISSIIENVETLPNDLNYPIHFQSQLLDQYKIQHVDSLKHIHYHRLFDGSDFKIHEIQELGFNSKAEEIWSLLNQSTL